MGRCNLFLVLAFLTACSSKGASTPAGDAAGGSAQTGGSTEGLGGKSGGATGGGFSSGGVGGTAGSAATTNTGGNTSGSSSDAGTPSNDAAIDSGLPDGSSSLDGASEALPPIGSRLSFTDWYVGGLQGSAEGAFAFAAKTGLNGVEANPTYDGNSPKLLNSQSLRQQYFDAEKKYGLKLSSFCLGDLWVDKLVTDASSVDKIKSLIDVCVLMDVHVILLPIFADYSKAAVVDTIVERIKLVTPKAESAGIILGVENYETAETNAALLKRVGSPMFKVYYDIGNSSQRNRDIYSEIRSLGDSICQIHVKDQQTSSSVPGIGKIDFPKFKQALVDINYHGWLTLELGTGEANYKASADYVKKIFTSSP